MVAKDRLETELGTHSRSPSPFLRPVSRLLQRIHELAWAGELADYLRLLRGAVFAVGDDPPGAEGVICRSRGSCAFCSVGYPSARNLAYSYLGLGQPHHGRRPSVVPFGLGRRTDGHQS